MTSFISFGPHCIFSCIGRGEEAHLNVERGTWASTTVSQSVYIASVFSKPGEMGGLGCCKS